MIETVIFAFGTIAIVWISLPSLHRPGSHGFYRFFAWEIILGLLVINLQKWFVAPFSWYQIISGSYCLYASSRSSMAFSCFALSASLPISSKQPPVW